MIQNRTVNNPSIIALLSQVYEANYCSTLFYFLKNIFFAFYGIWYNKKTQINEKED